MQCIAAPLNPTLLSRALVAVALAIAGGVAPALAAPPAAHEAAAKPKDGAKEAPKPPSKEKPGTAPAAPAPDGEFIEYRWLPEFNQITFTDNAVRGARGVEYLKQHLDDLAKRGVYACADEGRRHVYRQSQKAGDRLIESAVFIIPPTREGEGGDAFTARLVVKVNGRKKIDCALGTTTDGELWVSRVAIHTDDGSIEIRALSGDGEELNVPESQESLDDPTCITDDSFYEDDPAEPGAGPVKA